MEASIWFAPVISKYIKNYLKSHKIKQTHIITPKHSLDSINSESQLNQGSLKEPITYELQSVQKYNQTQIDMNGFQNWMVNANNEPPKSARSNWATPPRGNNEGMVWNPISAHSPDLDTSWSSTGETMWVNE
ncbi:hypothetical protein HK096_009833, partial [Nowakowskiella sp. JEL0078]